MGRLKGRERSCIRCESMVGGGGERENHFSMKGEKTI